MAKHLGWSRLQHRYGSSTFSVKPPPILPTTSFNSPKDRKEREGKGEVEGGGGELELDGGEKKGRREERRRRSGEAGSQRRAYHLGNLSVLVASCSTNDILLIF